MSLYAEFLRTETDAKLADIINFWAERVTRYPAVTSLHERYLEAIKEQARRIRENLPQERDTCDKK